VDELKQHEELLKDEVRSARESFGQESAELEREVSGIKRKLEQAASPDVKEELEADLAAAEEELR
jgi:predicted  nucleic acid-binding Zn-ribbon protein